MPMSAQEKKILFVSLVPAILFCLCCLTSRSSHRIFGSALPKLRRGLFAKDKQVNEVSEAVRHPWPAFRSELGEGEWGTVDRRPTGPSSPPPSCPFSFWNLLHAPVSKSAFQHSGWNSSASTRQLMPDDLRKTWPKEPELPIWLNTPA